MISNTSAHLLQVAHFVACVVLARAHRLQLLVQGGDLGLCDKQNTKDRNWWAD